MQLYLLTNLDYADLVKDPASIGVCLVAANNGQQARTIHPMSILNPEASTEELFFDHRSIWPYDLGRIGVTYLGISTSCLQAGCIGILQTADEIKKIASLRAASSLNQKGEQNG